MEPGSVPISAATPGIARASNLAHGDAQARLVNLGKAFVKYVVVGGAAFVVDFGLFSLCVSAGLHYLIAVTLGFCAGIVTNYLLCVLWVWRGTEARTVRDVVIFTLVGLGGLALTWLGMWICVDLLHWAPRCSHRAAGDRRACRLWLRKEPGYHK